MTMSPMYPCGKPCSTGTHNETVKRMAQSPAFDRSNHDRTTATTLSRRLIEKTLYKSEEGSSLYLMSAKLVF